MLLVALAAAALLVAFVLLATWALDLRADRDLLCDLYDGARRREAAAVRRANLADYRAERAESQLAALHTFAEEPNARPFHRAA